MKHLAPIALMVFNRPDHAEASLAALAKNDLALESELFVYADGARDEQDESGVKATRELLKNVKGFKKVTIVERESNWGLAKSIISAATELTEKYGKVIVVEDDLVTSKGFLTYMNDALDLYENDEQVMHISGYMFPVRTELPETFFYNTASTWGWATWKRAWQHFNNDINDLKAKLDASGRLKEFNIDGTNNFYNQILANFEGRRTTWGIRWYTTMFLMGGFALHPGKSLVQNIGNDGTGTNAGRQPEFWHAELAYYVKVERIPIQKSQVAWNAMKQYYSRVGKNKANMKNPSPIKQLFKKVVPGQIIDLIRSPEARAERAEQKRLQNHPRFQETTANLFGNQIRIPDSASYLFQKREIFGSEIYKFKSHKQKPYILDCGANIGLSAIYFKRLFPQAKVVAFEPDHKIYEIVKNNLHSFGFDDVEVINKGVWNEETELKFFAEGADGGKVDANATGDNMIKIKTLRLRDFLDEEVDFLKIDIEGSETTVLLDCADKLHNVKNIFIEYHSYAGSEQTLHQILEVLAKAGLRYFIYSMGQRQKNPYLDVQVKAGMDGQVNIAAIRA